MTFNESAKEYYHFVDKLVQAICEKDRSRIVDLFHESTHFSEKTIYEIIPAHKDLFPRWLKMRATIMEVNIHPITKQCLHLIYDWLIGGTKPLDIPMVNIFADLATA